MSDRDLYAWVTLMHDGRWSIVGCMVGALHLPLISHSLADLEGYRNLAEEHQRMTSQPVELVRWSSVQTVERL